MKNIYFIESPFQLLCAYEAIEKFKIQNNVLVVRYAANINSNVQLNNLINYDIFVKVYELDIVTNKDILFCVPFLFKILFFNNVNRLFLGDYRGRLMHLVYRLVNKAKIVLLDDGLYTLDLYEKMKADEVKKINLFTIFDLAPLDDLHIIYKNTFKKFKENICIKNQNQNDIYFFGARTVEAGYIHKEKYIEYIKKIKNYYESKKLNFIYIPHRGENIGKFQEIKGLNIKSFEYPSEIQFMLDFTAPYRIASFYSTTLVTLKYLYDVSYVDSFPYCYDDLAKNVQEDYQISEQLLQQYEFITFNDILKD